MWYNKASSVKISIVLLAAIYISLLAVPASIASLPHGKPKVPLTVWLQPLTEPVLGQVVEFSAHARSVIDMNNVVFRVVLPPHISLDAGGLVWRGDLNKNQLQSLRFSVKIPQTGSHLITANVIVGNKNSSQLTVATNFHIGSDSISQKSLTTQNIEYGIRHGRRLVQYKIH